MLFDLDDTLVDEASASRNAVLAWAATLGPVDQNAARRWAQVSARHYARYQRRELTFTEQRRERVREFLGRTLTDREADDLFAGYLEHYEAGWTVFDDALPTLQRARAAGLAVAVLTNGDEEQQRRKLDRLGLQDRIDLLVASSMLPAGKPDPRAFRHTLGLLDVAAADALMVGDSPANDVLGARAAGLQAVLLDRIDLHTELDRHGIHTGLNVPRVRSLHDIEFSEGSW